MTSNESLMCVCKRGPKNGSGLCWRCEIAALQWGDIERHERRRGIPVDVEDCETDERKARGY